MGSNISNNSSSVQTDKERSYSDNCDVNIDDDYCTGTTTTSSSNSGSKGELSSRRLSEQNLLTNRRRSTCHGKLEEDPWGWFEDFQDDDKNDVHLDDDILEKALSRTKSLPTPVSEPPVYVLESDLSYQQLWYETAGRRPKQPLTERAYFEKLWARNFENSSVPYSQQTNNNHNHKKESGNTRIVRDRVPQDEILSRGENSFSVSVSKTFDNATYSSMCLQVPRYRIRKQGKELHAEYLVVISLNSIVFGVWRRHSDFQRLVMKVHAKHEESEEHFKNSILSWKCVLYKQRWFRCLDKDYLALKCFLLERFMHDLLFESTAPKLITTFLGLNKFIT